MTITSDVSAPKFSFLGYLRLLTIKSKMLSATLRFMQYGLLFFILFAVVFWFSFFLHFAAITKFVPDVQHKWPVFLHFSDCNGRGIMCSNPVGVVATNFEQQTILAPPASKYIDNFIENNKYSYEKEGEQHSEGRNTVHDESISKFSQSSSSNTERGGILAGVFARGQQYSAQLIVEVPDSDANRQLGMFQLELSIYDHQDTVILSARRSVRLPYRPQLHRLLYSITQLPFLLFESSHTMTHTLTLPMVHSFIEDGSRPAHHIKVELLSRKLEWESCHVEFTAKLSGFRYFLYHYPITSFLLSMSINVIALFILILVIVHCILGLKQSTFKRYLQALQTLFSSETKESSAVKLNEFDKPQQEADDHHCSTPPTHCKNKSSISIDKSSEEKDESQLKSSINVPLKEDSFQCGGEDEEALPKELPAHGDDTRAQVTQSSLLDEQNADQLQSHRDHIKLSSLPLKQDVQDKITTGPVVRVDSNEDVQINEDKVINEWMKSSDWSEEQSLRKRTRDASVEDRSTPSSYAASEKSDDDFTVLGREEYVAPQ